MTQILCEKCQKNEKTWVHECADCHKGLCKECQQEFDDIYSYIYNEHFTICEVCKVGFNNMCDKCKKGVLKWMEEDKYVGDPDEYLEQEPCISSVCKCEWYKLGYDCFKCQDDSKIKAIKEFNSNIKIYFTCDAGYEITYCRECYIKNRGKEPSESSQYC